MRRTVAIASAVGVVIASAVFFADEWRAREIAYAYKCPEEYGSFDEYAHDTAMSIAAYKERDPDLTSEEISEKRKQLFMSHGCTGHAFFPGPADLTDAAD
jgi:hypothetical protein